MLLTLNIILAAIALILLIPSTMFCLENTLALLLGNINTPKAPPQITNRPRLAVLVPAHNEQTGIVKTVNSVKAQLNENDQILVVADNCTDNTAEAAQEAGAQVTVRHHETDRGKGFALAHGIDTLADESNAPPPEIIIFIDADCVPDPGTLDALAHQAQETHTAAQAINLSDVPAGESKITDRISAFAVRVKNESRPIGLSIMGGPCLITGTGFALPWDLTSSKQFGRGDIVEDMTIGLELAIAGNPPKVCTSARVHSDLPTSQAAKESQRERWEHGHIDTLLKSGLPLLARGIFTLRPKLILLGLELTVPPLSLLVMIISALAALTAAGVLVGLSIYPASIALTSLIFVSIGTLAGWWTVGRDIIPAHQIPVAAWYALCKIPIYFTAMLKRQTGWVRTARDNEEQGK